jgi:hypothetical protein
MQAVAVVILVMMGVGVGVGVRMGVGVGVERDGNTAHLSSRLSSSHASSQQYYFAWVTLIIAIAIRWYDTRPGEIRKR